MENKNIDKKYIYQAITKEYIGLDDFDEFKEIIDKSVNERLSGIELNLSNLSEQVKTNENNIGNIEDSLEVYSGEIETLNKLTADIKDVNLQQTAEIQKLNQNQVVMQSDLTEMQSLLLKQGSTIISLTNRITALENKPASGPIIGEYRYFEIGTKIPSGWVKVNDGGQNHILTNSTVSNPAVTVGGVMSTLKDSFSFIDTQDNSITTYNTIKTELYIYRG